jgi:phospholipid transport system substrate-binding protein
MSSTLLACLTLIAGFSGFAVLAVAQQGPATAPVRTIALASGHAAESNRTAPDVLVSTTTLAVAAHLRQDRAAAVHNPGQGSEWIASTVLPLFDLQRMTELAMAHDWPLASVQQQAALVAEFGTLLVRTYVMALTSYRDQVIEYKPLHLAPDESTVTVKSTVSQPGGERLTLDYDMEKTLSGWKVYDIKIAGISLLTTYRSTFAEIVRDRGVDGVISSLSAKNRQAAVGPAVTDATTGPLFFMFSVMPGFFRSER